MGEKIRDRLGRTAVPLHSKSINAQTASVAASFMLV